MLPREYISKFCAVSDPRLWLMRPARDDHRLLASDGWIAIDAPDDTDVAVMAGSPLVHALGKMFDPMPARTNWTPVDMALPAPVKCPVCYGLGKTVVCEHCEGEGVVESDFGMEELDCPKCGGKAEWPNTNGSACRSCDGSGEGYLAIPFGHTFFQRKYLALLQTLPGPVELSIGELPSTIAFFRFSGGHGALMPCRES